MGACTELFHQNHQNHHNSTLYEDQARRAFDFFMMPWNVICLHHVVYTEMMGKLSQNHFNQINAYMSLQRDRQAPCAFDFFMAPWTCTCHHHVVNTSLTWWGHAENYRTKISAVCLSTKRPPSPMSIWFLHGTLDLHLSPSCRQHFTNMMRTCRELSHQNQCGLSLYKETAKPHEHLISSWHPGLAPVTIMSSTLH